MISNIRKFTEKLVSVLISINVFVTDEILDELDIFVSHYIEDHHITIDNLLRLIEGFIDIRLKDANINQRCKFHSNLDSSNRCVLSKTWGSQKDWNTKGTTANKTVYRYFSSSVLKYVDRLNAGLGIVSERLIENKDYKKVYIADLDVDATALQRISTKYQLKKLGKDETDFDGLIKSINKKAKDVGKYIIEGFNQPSDFVYLKPIAGKVNWVTLLFRVPFITNLFVELYKNTGKKLIAKINGDDTIISLTQLQDSITKGYEKTEGEKVYAYITNCYNRNNRGQLTQLFIFAFGLFQYEVNSLITMLVDSSKGKISKDYLESCVKSAKKGIIDYKDAFLLKDRALEVYRNKIDEFARLIVGTTVYEEFDSTKANTVCGLKIRKSWNFCPKCSESIETHERN